MADDQEEEEVKEDNTATPEQSTPKRRTGSIAKMEAIFSKSDAFLEKLVSKIESKGSEILTRKSIGASA